MKIIRNIILVFLVLAFLSILAFYLFFTWKGQTFVEEKLSLALERPVRMNALRIVFPFRLICEDLRVQGLLFAKEMEVRLTLPSLLSRNVHIAWLIFKEPVFTIQKIKDKRVVLGDIPLSSASEENFPAASVGAAASAGAAAPSSPPSTAQSGQKPPGFLVDYLVVQNGQVRLVDHSGEKETGLILQEVDFKVRNLAYPLESRNMDFDFAAAILKSDLPFSGSRLEGRGWINIPQRNLRGELKVMESDGKVSLLARLNSVNNDMTVQGKIKIKNLLGFKREKEKQKESEAFSFHNMMFEALQSSGLEIDADFSFETKMDHFDVGAVSFSGNVGYQLPEKGSLENKLPLPALPAPK